MTFWFRENKVLTRCKNESTYRLTALVTANAGIISMTKIVNPQVSRKEFLSIGLDPLRFVSQKKSHSWDPILDETRARSCDLLSPHGRFSLAKVFARCQSLSRCAIYKRIMEPFIPAFCVCVYPFPTHLFDRTGRRKSPAAKVAFASTLSCLLARFSAYTQCGLRGPALENGACTCRVERKDAVQWVIMHNYSHNGD